VRSSRSEVTPIGRASLSGSVFARLREQILSGELAPDQPLPSERTLSEQLGVNRHAIREALKRLEQAGLVRVSHGGATRVLDWRRTGGLDLLVELVLVGGPAILTADVLRGVLELRVVIGADAARRCAERATERLRQDLRERADQLAAIDLAPGQGERSAAGGGSTDADRGVAVAHRAELRRERYNALWETIVDGADNLAYRLAFNSLLAGVAALPEAMLPFHAEEFGDRDGRQALVGAILDGDGDGAEGAARALLSQTLAHALGVAGGAR
jgi:GntR family transcriptional repressor for pyruvate dehydrogenase complex